MGYTIIPQEVSLTNMVEFINLDTTPRDFYVSTTSGSGDSGYVEQASYEIPEGYNYININVAGYAKHGYPGASGYGNVFIKIEVDGNTIFDENIGGCSNGRPYSGTNNYRTDLNITLGCQVSATSTHTVKIYARGTYNVGSGVSGTAYAGAYIRNVFITGVRSS